MSPNPDAIFRLQIELVPRRDPVGFVASFDIAHGIAAVFSSLPGTNPKRTVVSTEPIRVTLRLSAERFPAIQTPA
jgi:hypothetical protein